MRNVPLLALIVAGWICSTRVAEAATISQTLTKWGLIGTWAQDCTRPPDRSGNVHMTYTIEGERVRRKEDYGDSQPVHDVVGAEILRDGTLVWRLAYPDEGIGTYEFDAEHGGDGRMRTIYAHNLDTGEYTVRNRAFAPQGGQVPWMTRCE